MVVEEHQEISPHEVSYGSCFWSVVSSGVMVDVAERLLLEEEEMSGCCLTVVGGGRESAEVFTQLAAIMGVQYQVFGQMYFTQCRL